MTIEMGPAYLEKANIFKSSWLRIKGFPSKLLAKIDENVTLAKNISKDDPRKLIHSLKVGLTLTLVSFFYYLKPLYNDFGVSAMWAIMTVIVVFEFSVGATLGKGLNRGLATLVAGALGLGAHHLANVTGKTCEPILIGIFVFLLAVPTTFIRFFPKVKARYDYGMMIFILTFCLVSISGVRTDEILILAQQRLSTILIGATTCVIVSIFVCPVWAGEDLHKLIAKNIEKLGNFMEGFSDEYFRTPEMVELSTGRFSLNSVLDSKTNEENLANFARWEPGHGKFMYRHPWKQYLKIGALTRQCACRIEALKGYLNSKTQPPQNIQGMIQEAISSMSSESGKALKELSMSIATMTKPSSPNPHISNLKLASKNLKSLLQSDLWDQQNTNLLEIVPVAAVASLVIDIVINIENIADGLNELSSLANFKNKDLFDGVDHGKSTKKKRLKQVAMDDIPHVSIEIDGPISVRLENESSNIEGTVKMNSTL